MEEILEYKYIEVLKYLIEHRHTTYNELAQYLNVSTKTASKYVRILQESLAEEEEVAIHVKPRFGIEMVGTEEAWLSILLSMQRPKNDSIQDRITHVYSRLLNTKGHLKIQDLADELFVSRATMENTIKEIRKRLEKEGVAIVSNRNGLKIDATEKMKRHFMSDVISYYWGGVTATNLFKKEELELGINMIGDTTNIIDVNLLHSITNVLNIFIESTSLQVTEYEYQSLSIHLAIAIERIKKNFYIDKKIAPANAPSKYATLLIELLEEKFQIQLPDYEREYIDIHILAIEKSSLNDTDGEMLQVLDDSEKLQQIIRSTLGGYSPDEELINSLLVHLNAAVKRLKLEVSIHNPYTEEIKGNFSGAFAISIELASAIEAGFAIKLNEDEIAFITLHIQSFLDREAQTKREVILVCSSGYGTSKLLEQRIRQTFGAALHVKQVLGIRDLQKANIQDELIISTIPIEKSNSPILVVSPLMTNADIQKINTFLTKHTTSSSDVFLKLLKKTFVCISTAGPEKRNAVLEKITSTLLTHGYVHEGIYEGSLKREKLASTAMGMFAMPHAEITYVNKPSISMYVNENGIDWNGDTVQVVFFFALNQAVKKSINQIYAYFNEVISNHKVMKKLPHCKTYSEITNVLKEVLYDDTK